MSEETINSSITPGPPISRYHREIGPPTPDPPKERINVPGLGAQASLEGEPTPPFAPHSGLGAARTLQGLRTPGPTPYLGGEGKEQQQRASRCWHRAQRLLLQSQHVREAPMAGDPEPCQHLRRGNKATRRGHWPAGGTRREARRIHTLAPLPAAWEEPGTRPTPPPTRAGRNDTAQSAAHTWLPRRRGTRVCAARATPSGALLGGSHLSPAFSIPPPTRFAESSPDLMQGQREGAPAPPPLERARRRSAPAPPGEGERGSTSRHSLCSASERQMQRKKCKNKSSQRYRYLVRADPRPYTPWVTVHLTLTSGLISIGLSCIFAKAERNRNPKKTKNSKWSRPACRYKAPA